jgi:hypothetical protein
MELQSSPPVVTILEELVSYNTSKSTQVASILPTSRIARDIISPPVLETSSLLEKERNQSSHSSHPRVLNCLSKKKKREDLRKNTANEDHQAKAQNKHEITVEGMMIKMITNKFNLSLKLFKHT